MESKVADPIEEALNTMSGIKLLRSVNLESVTQVIIQFELSVDREAATQEVRDRVAAILRRLPAGIDPPTVQKFDVGAAPVMSVALAGKLAPRELTRIGEDVVKERIQRLPGVGSVELVGGRRREPFRIRAGRRQPDHTDSGEDRPTGHRRSAGGRPFGLARETEVAARHRRPSSQASPPD